MAFDSQISNQTNQEVLRKQLEQPGAGGVKMTNPGLEDFQTARALDMNKQYTPEEKAREHLDKNLKTMMADKGFVTKYDEKQRDQEQKTAQRNEKLSELSASIKNAPDSVLSQYLKAKLPEIDKEAAKVELPHPLH